MIKLLKFIYRSRILFWILTLPFKFIDFINLKKKDEIFFYGYRGRYIGNAKALFEYYLENDTGIKPIWLLDKRDNKFVANKDGTYPLPSKQSNIWVHIKFIFRLQKSRVLVVTSVGDLSVHTQFLFNKKHIKVLLPHGVSLKSTGIMAKHLSKSQKRIWVNIPQRFDLISAASIVEKYWLSAGFVFDPNKIKVLGPQRKDKENKNTGYSKFETKIKLLEDSNISVDITNDTKFILYAPSHRDHKELSYNFTLFENIENYNLIDLDKYLGDKDVILFLKNIWLLHQITISVTLKKI